MSFDQRQNVLPAAKTEPPRPAQECAPKPGPSGHRAFAALLVGFLVYACLFILRTSFVVDGVRYFVLFDDAMISMRFAHNLASGFGLVWNPGGEHVEGITNLGWALVMAAVHLLPLSLAKTSLLVQALGAGSIAGTLFVVRRLGALLSPDRPAATGNLAALFTAFYYPLVNWSLQGMEVGVLAFLVALSLWMVLRPGSENKGSLGTYLVLGLATLIRLDAACILGIVWLWQLIEAKGARARHAVVGLAAMLVFVGGQTLFRLHYYGDPFPNTYYLKMTGFPVLLRISRGAFYGALWAGMLLWPVAALGLAAALKAVRDKGQWRVPTALRPAGLLLLVCAAQSAYSAYVGGDAWERIGGANRFESIITPCLFVMLAHGILCFCERLVPGSPRRRQVAVGLASLAVLLNANAFYGRQSLAQWLLVERPLFIEDNRRNVVLARTLTRATTAQVRIAIDAAGTAPYFTDRTFLDLHGKSDRHVAHALAHRHVMPVPAWREFYPGHLKWDYAYSIGQQKPDVVAAIWKRAKSDSDLYLKDYEQRNVEGVSVHLKKGSAFIDWAYCSALAKAF